MPVAGAVRVAERWWQRLRGMLGRPEPEPEEGLLLLSCRAVHMVGMGYPLDVVFLGRDGTVLATYPALRPGSRTGYHGDAWAALELRRGTLARAGVTLGDRLEWEAVP